MASLEDRRGNYKFGVAISSQAFMVLLISISKMSTNEKEVLGLKVAKKDFRARESSPLCKESSIKRTS